MISAIYKVKMSNISCCWLLKNKELFPIIFIFSVYSYVYMCTISQLDISFEGLEISKSIVYMVVKTNNRIMTCVYLHQALIQHHFGFVLFSRYVHVKIATEKSDTTERC